MALDVTERITQFIGGHEGKVLTWYLDPAHVPTIGYGFTWGSKVFREWWLASRGRKMRKGDTMTEAEALEVLTLILETEYAPPVDAALRNAPSHVREAAYSAVYNLGPRALKWKWAQALQAGDIKGGAALWRKMGRTAGGKVLPGLVRRRNEEADIAERDLWPQWLAGKWETIAPGSAPDTHIDAVDIRQAQIWLGQLGYPCGAVDGIAGPRTKQAVARFQDAHGTLKVDGIIGRATLAALQRAIDLRAKATTVGGSGAGAVVAGAADKTTGASSAVVPDAVAPDPGWIGDVLLWGGLAVLVIGVIWLGWRYRDELAAFGRKL